MRNGMRLISSNMRYGHRPVSCYEFRGHVKSLTALHTAPLECGLGVADAEVHKTLNKRLLATCVIASLGGLLFWFRYCGHRGTTGSLTSVFHLSPLALALRSQVPLGTVLALPLQARWEILPVVRLSTRPRLALRAHGPGVCMAWAGTPSCAFAYSQAWQ